MSLSTVFSVCLNQSKIMGPVEFDKGHSSHLPHFYRPQLNESMWPSGQKTDEKEGNSAPPELR